LERVGVEIVILMLTVLRFRKPYERPTAEKLLAEHPFCELDPGYNFFDTLLYKKIKGHDLT
jgi:mitogen-activated protein kinase kinase kinase